MPSAIKGLKLDAPQLTPLVVPITVVILLALFIVQRQGTSFMGAIFASVILVWFAAIGLNRRYTLYSDEVGSGLSFTRNLSMLTTPPVRMKVEGTIRSLAALQVGPTIRKATCKSGSVGAGNGGRPV